MGVRKGCTTAVRYHLAKEKGAVDMWCRGMGIKEIVKHIRKYENSDYAQCVRVRE